MDTNKTAALIPAAGMGIRMGDFKPLLPLGQKTVIAQVISPFHAVGIENIWVVVGHRAEELIPTLEERGVRWVQNPDFSQGMFSSIKTGVAALASEADAFFILPADIPLVRTSTLSILLDAAAGSSEKIYYPTFNGIRGHPPLIPTVYCGPIQHWTGEGGMGGFLHGQDANAVDVPVADEGILFDLDTPTDYRQACARVQNFNTPTPDECLALMQIHFGPDAPVTRHCRAVASIALEMAAALIRTGCTLDPELIQAASLVHDVAKGVPDHALAGAGLLSSLGFPRVADVIREHMDLMAPGIGPIEERELVYLADKLVQGDHPVDMDARFDDKLRRHGRDPLKSSAITRRRDHAMTVKARIEARLGQPLESALSRLQG